MTPGILQSIKSRDKIYKKLKSASSVSKYNSIEMRLKTFCCILQKTIRTAKTQHYHCLFERYKTDIRKTWATINELITKKTKNDVLPEHFVDKDKLITNDKDIADCLNNFFTNVGQTFQIQSRLPLINHILTI